LHVPGGWEVQPTIGRRVRRSTPDGRRWRPPCLRFVPHRVVEKGGTSGHRYPSPGLGPYSTSVPGLGKFIAPFVARQPGNCVRKHAFFGYFRFGRATSSPPQLGQMPFMPAAQLGQKVHSWLQMWASASNGRPAAHFSHEGLISRVMWARGRALGPPEPAASALVRFFAGGIDASGVVFVALSAALRHPRRPLRISEAF
jgi:hypothetical protein